MWPVVPTAGSTFDRDRMTEDVTMIERHTPTCKKKPAHPRTTGENEDTSFRRVCLVRNPDGLERVHFRTAGARQHRKRRKNSYHNKGGEDVQSSTPP